MNNREWLNNLAANDITALDAWFDAEHVESDNGGLERLSDGADVKSDELTDAFRKYESVEGRNIVIDGAAFADSREKLEADVYRAADKMDAFYCGERFLDTRKIIGWLDRQALITHSIDAWNIERLEKQVAELQAELDKWRKLTANIELPDYPMTQFVPKDERRKLEARIHEWLTSHVGVSVYTSEIEAEAKKWMNKAANIRGREIGFRMENWAKRVDDQSREIAELKAELDETTDKLRYFRDVKCYELELERDNLADDLLACNREREHLRKNLGIALDYAHDICQLVDIGE